MFGIVYRVIATQLVKVDDEPTLASLNTTILEMAGFEVTFAHSGIQALEILNQQSFDLLLTDVMPNMDGYVLAQ